MVDFEEVRDQYHRALEVFITGDPDASQPVWSKRDDVTLANPLGPPVRGWDAVRETIERAAAQVRDGEALTIESLSTYATPDLAYEITLERCIAKVGGAATATPITLRVTTIFRREDDGWKVVHRHADPITGPRPVESLIQP
jgi:ketosteroid isomerase-like protein